MCICGSLILTPVYVCFVALSKSGEQYEIRKETHLPSRAKEESETKMASIDKSDNTDNTDIEFGRSSLAIVM